MGHSTFYREPATPDESAVDPFGPHLLVNEQVLWKDRARQGFTGTYWHGRARAVGMLAGMIVMPSVMLMAFLREPYADVLLLGAVCVMSLYIVSQHLLDVYRRYRTYYALTDRRVIIVYGDKARSVALEDLAEVRLFDRWKGHPRIMLRRRLHAFRHRRMPLLCWFWELVGAAVLEIDRHVPEVYRAILAQRERRLAAGEG